MKKKRKVKNIVKIYGNMTREPFCETIYANKNIFKKFKEKNVLIEMFWL
jgi:hypothetical protein